MAFTFAACSSSNVIATATPAGVAANSTIPGTTTASVAQCTPTPASPAPTFTLPPNGQYTPGVLNTSIAAYQATYPGGVIDPKQLTDLDPQLPERDKEHIVVQLAGCTYQTVLLDPSKVANYVNNPPPGVAVIAVAPPFSAFEQQRPNAAATLPPGRTPGVAYNASGTPVTVQPNRTVPAPPPPSLLTERPINMRPSLPKVVPSIQPRQAG